MATDSSIVQAGFWAVVASVITAIIAFIKHRTDAADKDHGREVGTLNNRITSLETSLAGLTDKYETVLRQMSAQAVELATVKEQLKFYIKHTAELDEREQLRQNHLRTLEAANIQLDEENAKLRATNTALTTENGILRSALQKKPLPPAPSADARPV